MGANGENPRAQGLQMQGAAVQIDVPPVRGATDPLNLSALCPKSQKVSAFSLPSLTRGFPDKTLESAERCFALMREGRLKVYISRTFPLAQAAEAHRYLESRESTGKLILLP